MRWQFLNTGANTGSFNMEYDKALALHCKEHQSSSVFRLYSWNPYTISIGFNQAIEDFDRPAVAAAGFDIVRRPTGGKAIFHAHEVTYSVVTRITERGPRQLYRWINEGLLHGLHILGIQAELSESSPDFRTLYRDAASIPCFSSSAKSEIQYFGKKLIGSAQRRYGSVILQHGSFLLGPQHQRIVEFLAAHVQDSKEIIEHELTAHTTDAETILGRPISYNEAAKAMRMGFQDHCGITFTESFTSDNNLLQQPPRMVLS